MSRRKIDNSEFYNSIYKDYKDNILTIQQIAEKYKIAIKTIYNIKGYIEKNKNNNLIEEKPLEIIRRNSKNNFSDDLWFGTPSTSNIPVEKPIKKKPKKVISLVNDPKYKDFFN